MVQQSERIAYRNLVTSLIHDLLCVHYYTTPAGLCAVKQGLTQKQISTGIGSTPAVVSRAYTGVTSLSAESFYLLCKLHDSHLYGICEPILNI